MFTPSHLYTAGAAPTTLLAPGDLESGCGGTGPASAAGEAGQAPATASAAVAAVGAEDHVIGGSAAIGIRRAAYDVYVIVDI